MSEKNEDMFVKRAVTPDVNEEKGEKAPTRRIVAERSSGGRAKTSDRTEKNLPQTKAASSSVAVEKTEAEKWKFFSLPKSLKAGSVDMVFLVLLVMLLAIGAVMSFSASYAYAAKKYGDSYYYVEKQLIFMFLGAVGIVMVTLFPLKTYKIVTWAVFGTSIVLLLLVLVMGAERGGARRWLEIPGLGLFQPSELAKSALVMILALYMSRFGDEVQTPGFKKSFLYGIVYPGLIIALIGGLVVLEKHFSGLIILCCIGLAVMVLGGSKFSFIIPMGLAAAGLIAVLILFTGYSSSRIDIWLDPWAYPQDGGWQTIQGLYAIASGGIWGQGLGNSNQKYGYVSEPQNDFIFTIVCEELGFIGAMAVMVLFFLLIWRGFTIARRSPNRFTYLIVIGLMVKIALQVGFNIAVVTNTIPNTGISLPFFSSGGTSLIVQMAEMGIVLSVSRYSYIKK